MSEEDEVYEQCICETNLVFEAVNDELVEVNEYSRKPLHYSMLLSGKVRFRLTLLIKLSPCKQIVFTSPQQTTLEPNQ